MLDIAALCCGIRAAVALDWFWAYLTSRCGTRLITDSSPDLVFVQDIHE
ncbi:hypothetical protein AAB988_22755 [Burkholderia contaminans]